MKHLLKKSKRMLGMLLCVLLVLESSGMQSLAAELTVDWQAEAAAEADAEQAISNGDVSGSDIKETSVAVM